MSSFFFRKENIYATKVNIYMDGIDKSIELLKERKEATNCFRFAEINDIFFMRQQKDIISAIVEALIIITEMNKDVFTFDLLAGRCIEKNTVSYVKEIKHVPLDELPLYIYMSEHTETYKKLLSELGESL